MTRRRPTTTICTLPRMTVRADEAAAMFGVSRETWDRSYRSGTIGPLALDLGGCRVWSVAELEQWRDAGLPHRETWVAQQEKERNRPRLAG